MHTHLITPLAPLVLRTGKPFGETGGGDSHAFPLPSTVAGCLRTAVADARRWSLNDRQALMALGLDGVLLCRLRGQTATPLYPRPLDARYVATAHGVALERAAPADLRDGEGIDLPHGLSPVLLDNPQPGKPAHGPAWWTAEAMATWLRGGTPPPPWGPEPIPVDTRTHVAIDAHTLAADSGRLFQSAGPDYEAQRSSSGSTRGWSDARFALLARFGERIDRTLVRLGGEGRLSVLEPDADWPLADAALCAQIEAAGRFRCVLASPAAFDAGWLPGWLDADLTGAPPGIPGLRVKLRAALVERWLPVSGWDMAARKPKAVRRVVPAGSVYWFEVLQSEPGWARALWLTSVSDQAQDRRDGFGLSLPGVWTDSSGGGS